MSKKRRNPSPEFKSKVALAAIKGDQALSELSRQYGIKGKEAAHACVQTLSNQHFVKERFQAA